MHRMFLVTNHLYYLLQDNNWKAHVLATSLLSLKMGLFFTALASRPDVFNQTQRTVPG
jgi:hypothetical protein